MKLPELLYCERTGAGFWAEPINALSNLGFLIAAILIFFRLRREHTINSYWLLPTSLVSVFVGSFLWHTLRTDTAHIMDGGLLYLFIVIVLVFLLKKIKVSVWYGSAAVILFLVIQALIYFLVPSTQDQPTRHIISLMTLIGLLPLLKARLKAIPPSMYLTAVFYLLAIVSKSVDLTVCEQFPIGTHFLWHLFGATAAYMSVDMLLAAHSIDK